MKNQDFVSVVIPTYNRGHVVSRAVGSVLTQSHRNFELIVVDDASTDNTEDVIASIGDSRIKYIKHEKNRGVSAARNTGIEAATGEFLALHDDDDIWLPDKLEKQLDCIRNKSADADVVYTRACRLEGARKTYIPSGNIRLLEGNIYHSLLWKNYIAMPSVLIKRHCIKKVGLFNVKLIVTQDWDFLLRLSRHYRFKYVEEPLVIVHHTPGSLLSRKTSLANEVATIMENNLAAISGDRKLLARYLAYRGHLMCLTGQIQQGREYILQAVKVLPSNVSYLFGFLATYGGDKIYENLSRIYLDIAAGFY